MYDTSYVGEESSTIQKQTSLVSFSTSHVGYNLFAIKVKPCLVAMVTHLYVYSGTSLIRTDTLWTKILHPN